MLIHLSAAALLLSPSSPRPQDDAASAAADALPRPNVLVLVADDLGYMDTSPYNAETFYETPHLARLAEEGVRFTQGYAAAPVCSPTRYALQTGRHPARGKATEWFSGRRKERFQGAEYDDRMALEEVTIAEALKAEGYDTFFAGKWHLGKDEGLWPEHQGYDINLGGHERGGPYGPGKYFTPYGNPRLEDGPEGELLTERLGRETAAFVRAHGEGGPRNGAPFFAMLSFYAVHTPLMTTEALQAKYKAKRLELGLTSVEDSERYAPEEQCWPTERPRKVRVVQDNPIYAGMVESMDAAVGAVLTALEESGLDANTIVVFTSDNGGLSTSEGSPTSNLPLRGGKGWLYEGGIREPWLVRWPGVTTGGAVSDVPVTSYDLLPTVLDAVGATLPAGVAIDGTSFVPALRGDAELRRVTPLIWHYPHYGNQGGFPGAAIRRGDWKLIERHEDGRVHLYDLANDVGEANDLAETQADVVEELRMELHAWYDAMDAQFLRAIENRESPFHELVPWRPGRDAE